MSRFLIQDQATHQFLYSDPITADVTWTRSLPAAVRFGVISDEETGLEMLRDHCDKSAILVDLDFSE
jgi:hypothetical protein